MNTILDRKMISAILVVLVFLVSVTAIAVVPVGAAKPVQVYPGDSIQEAVNAASPGATIIVNEGVYHQSVVIDKSIILRGNGAILDGAGPVDETTPPSTLTYDAITIAEGVEDVTIKNFEICNYKDTGSGQGNGIQAWNSGTSKITILGNTIHDNGWNAILVGNEGTGLHAGWKIKDNTVYNNGFYNVEITNGKDCEIAGNTITGPGGIYAVGILVQARNFANPEPVTSSGIVVKTNIVRGFAEDRRTGITYSPMLTLERKLS